MAKSWLYTLSALVVGIFCGWLLGNQQDVQIVKEVCYIERPTTRIAFDLPKPTKVERVELPNIRYHDTITITERIPADTAGIVADYFNKREYELDFSTDSTGIFKVNAVVHCNRLASTSATITPYQREVAHTLVKTRKFRPYLGGGIGVGSKWSASVEVGAMLKEHHLPRVGYQRIGNGNYITINYGYLF